jgi:DNA (cytosine-5)-methyltransferase 1
LARSKIYLKTEFAWYILDAPSELYHIYFVGFWLKHRVLHLLVTSALANPNITLAGFFQSPVVKEDASSILQVLGRLLSRDDILSEDIVRKLICLYIITLTLL